MKAQFSHEIFSAFFLWFENKLVSDKAKAYVENQSNTFEYTSGIGEVPSSHYAYQGQFRQLVADHNIDTPNSGVFINGNFVTGSSSDIYIDYENGRVIVPQASGTSLTITANNTVKEVNTYMSSDDEEQILLTSDFVDLADTTTTNLFSKNSRRDEKTFLLPCCFLRLISDENSRLAFGGEDDTRIRIRAIVLAKDNYTIDGVLSLFSDAENECVNLFPYEDYPYGIFNSIKSFPYSYDSFKSGYSTSAYIEEVRASKVVDSITIDKIEEGVLIGFLDFDLSTYRYPRA